MGLAPWGPALGLLLLFFGLLWVAYTYGRFVQANYERRHVGRQMERLMGDLSRLNAAVTALADAITKLIAAQGASDQAGIDAAQTQVEGLTAQVTAATPPAP